MLGPVTSSSCLIIGKRSLCQTVLILRVELMIRYMHITMVSIHSEHHKDFP